MTTPGGVPNLPLGALTLDTLASKTQDMTTPAMKARAVERFPTIFNSSTGLNPALDITPFGILTGIFSGFNSQVANADPADVNGPEDLPGLLLQFIEGLPVIGQFVDLLDAILGTYTGTDATLLSVQAIFAPIRAIVDTLTAVSGGTGGLGNFFPNLLGLLGNPTGMGGAGTPTLPGLSSIPLLGGLFSGGTLLGSLIPGLDASKIVSGTFGVGLLQPLIDAISTGFGGGSGLGFTGLTSMLSGLPVAGAVIDALLNALGISGTGHSTTNLLNVFTDLGGILGNPTGLGTGTVGLPGIGSIPILGGLLSGGNILGSLIPGLDASKIITGAFPISMITDLSTLLTGFGTSSSILTQLLGLIPNATGGLSGLTGLGSVFTDLFGLVGSPTAVGSGAPVLPGIGSIPLLGGLLSGGNILGSIIPGLDASKITTGTFAQSMITGLPSALAALVSGTSFQSLIDAMYQGIFGGTSTGNTAAAVQGGLAAFPGANLIGSVASSLLSGVLSGGLIPSLDASKVTTGTFGSGLIPGLDVSKIVSGVFGAGFIPSLDASKVTTGTLGSGRIPDITLGMSSAVQSVVDQAYQITQGGSSTGNSLTTFGPSFGGLLDNLTNNITGAPASGNRNTDMGAAVAGQTDTINGNAAAIAQMKAASGGGNTDSDDMERVSTTTMGANYLVLASAAGTLATPDGHNASFVGASTTCDYVARRTNIKAATDTQTVTIILGSQCGALPPLISTAYGHVDLWLRMTAFTTWATRTGVRFRWGADGLITLHRVINGAETKMYPPSGNVSKGNPPNNAGISFSSGVGGVARRFTASLNGAVIMDFTETGTTSQLGVNNRFRGFGGRYEYSLPLVDGQPGKIAQWTASG